MKEPDFLKQYIQKNRAYFEHEELPEALFERIEKRLEVNIVQKRSKPLKIWLWTAVAAAMILAIGALMFQPPSVHKEQVLVQQVNIKHNKVPKTNSSKQVELEEPSVEIITENHERKVHLAKAITLSPEQQLIKDMNNSGSAATRLNAVLRSANWPQDNDRVKNALLERYKTDENINVRLAAFEQLASYNQDQAIIEELEKSLLAQNDPNMQVELVNFISKRKNTENALKLIELAMRPNTNLVVKEQIYYSLVSN